MDLRNVGFFPQFARECAEGDVMSALGGPSCGRRRCRGLLSLMNRDSPPEDLCQADQRPRYDEDVTGTCDFLDRPGTDHYSIRELWQAGVTRREQDVLGVRDVPSRLKLRRVVAADVRYRRRLDRHQAAVRQHHSEVERETDRYEADAPEPPVQGEEGHKHHMGERKRDPERQLRTSVAREAVRDGQLQGHHGR